MLAPLLLAPARADSVEVCPTCYVSDLERAVEVACESEGPREIRVSGGVQGPMKITCGLELRGEDDAVLLAGTAFLAATVTVETIEPVSIRDLEIESSAGGGVVVIPGGEVDLDDVVVVGREKSLFSGAGLAVYGATVEVTGGAFLGLTSAAGGALYVEREGHLTLRGTTLAGNAAADGGAALVEGELVLDGVRAEGNYAFLLTGGVASAYGPRARVVVTGGTFGHPDDPYLANTALIAGGVFAVADGAVLEVDLAEDGSRPAFHHNEALAGGAVYARSADVTVRHADFAGNHASVGGAVALEDQLGGDTHLVEDCTFTAQLTDAGGAIEWYGAPYAAGGSLTVLGGSFVANQSGYFGAPAIGAFVPGELWIADSSFEGNSSGTYSGAVAISAVAQGRIERNVFCENASPLGHGALYAADAGQQAPLVLAGNRFVRNNGAGGVVGLLGGTVELRNQTFFGNAGLLGAVHADDTKLALTHTLFVSNAAPPLTGSADLREIAHSWSWREAYPPPEADPTARTDDPLLQGDGAAPGCDEPLWVEHGSPTRDAGDGPSDPDGSPTDVGAYGGPAADPWSWSDDDEDGAPLMWDCDPADPALALPEAWWPDSDADGAGAGEAGEVIFACEPPAGHGLGDDDCAEDDGDIFPGADEVPDDGVDQDCDGLDVRTFVAGAPCGCRGATGSGWLALALVGLARRPR